MKKKDGFQGERSLVLPRLIDDIMATDPIAAALHITDIGYYPCADCHSVRRDKPIDQYVFIYCVAGRGWFAVDEARYDVAPNQYFILPAGRPHAYGASDAEPWTIYWVHFRGSLARHYADGAATPHDVAPSLTSRISQRNALFEEIFDTLEASYAIESLRYAMSSFHHYLASLRYLGAYRSVGKVDATTADMLTAAITRFLEENIERHLTADDLARFTGYSATYLSARFKEHTGYSPLALFSLMKIQRACHLLDHTDMKISTISRKIGIDDPLYFSRLFSKTMGMAPKAYRERTNYLKGAATGA